jgi:hypothetical protein
VCHRLANLKEGSSNIEEQEKDVYISKRFNRLRLASHKLGQANYKFARVNTQH